MPRVPTLQGPTAQRSPLKPVYQRTPDVSSGLRGLGRGLDQAANVVDRRLQEQIDIETSTADAEITTNWLRWDAEARRQYQGGRIDEYETAAADWWEKAREEYGGRLSPAARQRLGQSLERRRGAALGGVAQHAATVRERHADEMAEASVAAAIEFGADTGKPESVRDEVATAAARMGARNGWSVEQVQQQQQKWLASLHLLHITRLAEGTGATTADPAAAQAYYEANKTEIPLTVQARVEQVIAGEKLNQEAKTKAAEWAGLPLGEQLERAAGLAPALRERTLVEIRSNHALVKEAEAERKAKYHNEAWQYAAAKGRMPSERLLGQLEGTDRARLQQYLIDRAEDSRRRAEGKPVKTDQKVFAELLDEATHNPEAFKRRQMVALVGKLDDGDMARVSSLQRDMLVPDREKETATTLQHILRYSAGLKTPQQKSEFEREALHAFEEHRVAKGKPPTMEERRVVLDRLSFEQSGWFSKSRFYQIPPQERAEWVRDAVPADAYTKIRAELKRVGAEATPENILDVYLRAQRK